MTARPDEVVAWRPVVRKDGNATCGYSAHMTSKPDNRDSDWRGEESRQWVRLSDHEAALQSANARLAAVLALADEWERVLKTMGGNGTPLTDNVISICAKELRRAAAGEGDANQGDGE